MPDRSEVIRLQKTCLVWLFPGEIPAQNGGPLYYLYEWPSGWRQSGIHSCLHDCAHLRGRFPEAAVSCIIPVPQIRINLLLGNRIKAGLSDSSVSCVWKGSWSMENSAVRGIHLRSFLSRSSNTSSSGLPRRHKTVHSCAQALRQALHRTSHTLFRALQEQPAGMKFHDAQWSDGKMSQLQWIQELQAPAGYSQPYFYVAFTVLVTVHSHFKPASKNSWQWLLYDISAFTKIWLRHLLQLS